MSALDSFHCSCTLIVQFQQGFNCLKSAENNRKRCEICSNLTIKTHQNDVIDIVLVSLLLTLNIFHNFFYCFYCWLWGPDCICLEQTSIRKRSKFFESNGFPCFILNNTHFFWNRSRKWKEFMISGKLETSTNKLVYPEGTFLWWGLLIPSFKLIAYVSTNKGMYVELHSVTGISVPSVKTTTYVCNSFNTSFCARDHKINQAISNLNQ